MVHTTRRRPFGAVLEGILFMSKGGRYIVTQLKPFKLLPVRYTGTVGAQSLWGLSARIQASIYLYLLAP